MKPSFSPKTKVRFSRALLAGALATVGLAFICFHFYAGEKAPAISTSQETEKPVYKLIEEDNLRQTEKKALHEKSGPKNAASEKPAPLKPVGVQFEAHKVAPKRALIQDPELGEVIEVTYADGRKLYEFPDASYNVSTGKFTQQPK